MRRNRARLAAVVAGLAALAGTETAAGPSGSGASLGEPQRVLANGKPINVTVGHAAPLVTDFDGDGVPDLLVGQFGDGELLVFRNGGTAAAPTFAEPTLFQADGKTGNVPSG
jgi:hypothetical protein